MLPRVAHLRDEPCRAQAKEQCLEAATTVAWEGRFGDADLKIEIPPSGRIHAEWRTPAGSRQKVVDSIEQLERSVARCLPTPP